jgi:uncharacterized LabA/DUF88 family protein
MKTALLIDGAFIRRKYRSARKNDITAPDIQHDEHFAPNLKQKGVDIKIGLDVAWASFNRLARNIILITGDSDFIPVIKTARRNGVFVYLMTLGHNVKLELCENVDFLNTEP